MTNKKVCDENRSVFLGVRGPFPGFSPSSLLPAVWRGVPPFTGAQNAVMSSVLWKPESQKMPLALSLFPSLPPSLLRKLLQLLSRLPPQGAGCLRAQRPCWRGPRSAATSPVPLPARAEVSLCPLRPTHTCEHRSVTCARSRAGALEGTVICVLLFFVLRLPGRHMCSIRYRPK